MPYVKYFLQRREGELSFGCVEMADDERDAITIAETEAKENFERWWDKDDKIEKLLPPEPYKTWSDFFWAMRKQDEAYIWKLCEGRN